MSRTRFPKLYFILFENFVLFLSILFDPSFFFQEKATPFHIACRSGHDEIGKNLALLSGIDVSIRDQVANFIFLILFWLGVCGFFLNLLFKKKNESGRRNSPSCCLSKELERDN